MAWRRAVIFDFHTGRHGHRRPPASPADVFDECILETNVLLSLLLCYYKSTYRGGMPKFIEKDGYIATTLPQALPLMLVLFLFKCLGASLE